MNDSTLNLLVTAALFLAALLVTIGSVWLLERFEHWRHCRAVRHGARCQQDHLGYKETAR